MRAVAGFSPRAGSYDLKRARVAPSPSLVSMIWPWVDESLGRYSRREIPDADLCGISFLQLLQKLRVVFLQDAAIQITEYPHLKIWTHAVFQHSDWPAFAHAVCEQEAVAEEREDERLRAVVPVVAERMATLQNSLGGLVVERSVHVETRMQDPSAAVTTGFRDLSSRLTAETNHLGSRMEQEFQKRDNRRLMLVPVDPVDPADPAGPVAPVDAVPSTSQSKSRPDSATTVAATSDEAPLGRSTGASADLPIEPLMSTMLSVASLWQEWHDGLETAEGRRLSVVALEDKFGHRWRYNSVIRTRWSNRQKIVTAIKEEALRRGVDPSILVDALDKPQADGFPRSPDKLKRLLFQGRPLSELL